MTSISHRPSRRGAAGVALLAALLAATTGACARLPQPSTDAPTLLIRVEHRADPATPLELWAVPEQGARLRLGLLTAESSNVIRFDQVDPKVQYRFVAERQGGPSISSPPFTPRGAGVVTWDLTANTITPVQR